MAINLGEINFGLGPDTSRLTKARQEILRFGQTVNASARAQGEGARQTEAALRRQERAILTTLQQVLKLNDAIRRTGANPANFHSTTQAMQRLLREFSAGRVSALQFQRSMEDMQATLGRVTRAIKTQENANKQLERSEREAQQATARQTAYTLKQEAALFRATEQVRKFQAELARTPNVPKSAALSMYATNSLAELRKSIGHGPIDPVQFQRASQIFQQQMTINTEKMRQFKATSDRVTREDGLPSFMRRIANTAVLVNGPLGGVSARLGVLASAASESGIAIAGAVTGVAAAVAGFVALSRGAISAAKSFERVEKALDSLNELQSYTGVQMDYIMDVSDRTGANFADLARQYAKMTAAAKGTNLEGERTRQIFELVTLAGAKMSLSQEEIGGTIKALEQIISKGSLQMEELRGQLGDRIPGAVQIMARSLGISTAELTKLTKQGKVTADALVPFAEELANTYGVSLGDSIDTLVTAEGRLFNAFLRFNKAMDDSLGISVAYKNILGGLASGLDMLTQHADRAAQIVVTLGAGFAGLFAPQIIGGLWGLVTVLRAATAAMVGLNTATMVNPIGALAMGITRLALAVGGAVVAWKLMDSTISPMPSQAEEMTTAFKQNEEALKQAGAASSQFRAELEAQIRMQKVAAEVALDEALAQATAAAAKVKSMQSAHTGGLGEVLFGPSYKSLALQGAESEAARLEDEARVLRDLWLNLEDQVDAITSLRETMGEGNSPLDPLGGAGSGSDSATSRAAKAIREATQAITEMDAAWQITQLPAGMREWATTIMESSKKVQDFKDKLVDAKVPTDIITQMTDKYAASLLRLNEAQYALEHTVPFWESFGDVIGRGLDSAFDTMIDAVIEGKDVLLELKDVGKAVATDLLKTFTQLAVVNPLKNLLFGQQNQTMSFGGGGGIGGFFSSLFGGLFGGGSAATGGTWGKGLWGSAIFSAKGNAFSGGGSVLSVPTMFNAGGNMAWGGELDNEAILPLGRTSSGELGVMTAGGENGGTNGAGDFVANFYLSANGDEAVMEIVKSAVSSAFDQYNASFTTRTAQANIKARLRRMPGSK